jgi:hypothetical protein
LLFLFNFQAQRQSKTVGVARQQRHFLCSDKENEAKESSTLRWACFTRFILVANIIGINLW